MKITKIEVDGDMYVVVKATDGSTYCEECSLENKCKRKNEKVFPCDIIGDEEIFIYETNT